MQQPDLGDEFVDLLPHGFELSLEFEDAPDPVEVDALVLTQVLDEPEPGDVVQRVPTPAAPRPRGHHEPEPVVGPQGCLLYTSDAADERSSVDLGGRRIIKKKTQEATQSHTVNIE